MTLKYNNLIIKNKIFLLNQKKEKFFNVSSLILKQITWAEGIKLRAIPDKNQSKNRG